MNFGEAIEIARNGERIARKGWAGQGQWVAYSPGSKALPVGNFWSDAVRNALTAEGRDNADVEPCMIMMTVRGTVQMGWLASQADMLADDWFVVVHVNETA